MLELQYTNAGSDNFVAVNIAIYSNKSNCNSEMITTVIQIPKETLHYDIKSLYLHKKVNSLM